MFACDRAPGAQETHRATANARERRALNNMLYSRRCWRLDVCFFDGADAQTLDQVIADAEGIDHHGQCPPRRRSLDRASGHQHHRKNKRPGANSDGSTACCLEPSAPWRSRSPYVSLGRLARGHKRTSHLPLLLRSRRFIFAPLDPSPLRLGTWIALLISILAF